MYAETGDNGRLVLQTHGGQVQYNRYAQKHSSDTCGMYKSSLRHIHDPELLPLKVEVIFDMVYFSVCLKCLGKLHIDMSANTRVDHHTLMFHLSVGGLLYK